VAAVAAEHALLHARAVRGVGRADELADRARERIRRGVAAVRVGPPARRSAGVPQARVAQVDVAVGPVVRVLVTEVRVRTVAVRLDLPAEVERARDACPVRVAAGIEDAEGGVVGGVPPAFSSFSTLQSS
jgi:hypothetical protein